MPKKYKTFIVASGLIILMTTSLFSTAASAHQWVRTRVIKKGPHRQIVIKERCHGNRHHQVCKKFVIKKRTHHRYWK